MEKKKKKLKDFRIGDTIQAKITTIVNYLKPGYTSSDYFAIIDDNNGDIKKIAKEIHEIKIPNPPLEKITKMERKQQIKLAGMVIAISSTRTVSTKTGQAFVTALNVCVDSKYEMKVNIWNLEEGRVQVNDVIQILYGETSIFRGITSITAHQYVINGDNQQVKAIKTNRKKISQKNFQLEKQSYNLIKEFADVSIIKITKLKKQSEQFAVHPISWIDVKYRKAKIRPRQCDFVPQWSNLYVADKLSLKKIHGVPNKKSNQFKYMYKHACRLHISTK